MRKRKYKHLAKYLINVHGLILSDSEQKKLQQCVTRDLSAINCTHCSELPKGENISAFEQWLKEFECDEPSETYWFDDNTLYCKAAMLQLFNNTITH